ncbi:MAG TPA: L,D-transpeptidase [Kiritimatiellia bacterium]|nr:L,D-transpeptidase [Kiritimatiellia bacterium]
MNDRMRDSTPRPGTLAAMAACLLALTGCVRLPVETPSSRPPPPAPPAPPVARPPAPAPAPAPPSVPADVLMAIQIRLDRAHCSPGGLDGRWGPKSRKALAAWHRKNGHPPADQVDATVMDRLGSTNGLMTAYTVTAADHAALSPVPDSWLERSRLDRLGFATIEELVAEKYHLFRAALRDLNPRAPWPDPPPGTVLNVPDVRAKPLPRLSRIDILVGEKSLRAYDAEGRLAAQFPCSIAADKSKRPVGETLQVVVWAENPDYTFDPALFPENPESAAIGKRLRIPPGPNNPVGVAWIGLDRPGYGIHGTPAPEDISRTESHGCFRLTNWDAAKLVHAVHAGLPVRVLP